MVTGAKQIHILQVNIKTRTHSSKRVGDSQPQGTDKGVDSGEG